MGILTALLAQVEYSVEVSSPGISAAAFAIIFIIAILFYVYGAYCLMKMAQRLGEEYPWLAWIPIANLYLIASMAGKDVVWFILMIIPCIGWVFLILCFMEISKRLGFEEWWGILMIIPIFNLYVLYKLAFTEPY